MTVKSDTLRAERFRPRHSARPGSAKGQRRLIVAVFLAILLLGLQPAALSAAERRNAVVEAVAEAGPAVVNIRTEQIVSRSHPTR